MLRLGAQVYLQVERLLLERPMLTSQVMTSFLVVAFFTIFLAFFPTFEEFKDWSISLRSSEDARSGDESHRFALSWTRIFMTLSHETLRPQSTNLSRTEFGRADARKVFARATPAPTNPKSIAASFALATARLFPTTRKVLDLLHPVSDIQVVTCLAIIVAGMGQWDHISFYHEQLISSYYGLTLNSFWAARISFMNVDADDGIRAMFVRRASILVSCILNVVWQFRIYYYENNGAWNNDGGPCYRFLDRLSPFFGLVFWNVGQIIFCIALASCMFEQTRCINEWYFASTERVSWFTGFLYFVLYFDP
jgi:hypothetical protein